jgi:two-component system, NarL family, nitrate/nitrite response regulator NarL
MPRTTEAAFLFLLGADARAGMREDLVMSLGQAAPDPVRIVVADDDPLFARMVRALVSARPEFEVVGIATNGREAVELNDELAPDVVLMDVGMPVLDGIEAAEIIRDRPDPPAVVLVTGDEDTPDARVYQAGAAAYVRKPADLMVLMDVILAVSQFALR